VQINKKSFFVHLSILGIVSLFIISCKTTQTISKKNIAPITITIDLVNIVDDKVKVEVLLHSASTDSLRYFMPKIIPGTYQNSDFGKYIENFEAIGINGDVLNTIKHGDNQWTINNAQQLKKITYWVNDTFDIEEEHNVFSPSGSNIEKDKNFILNLHAFIGYIEGMKENKYQLFVKHPKHLEASSALSQSYFDHGNSKFSYDIDYFKFNRYAEITDFPIMYTVPNTSSFSINGIEVLLSLYSNNPLHRASKITDDIERVMRAQTNFLGESNTTKKYSVLIYLSSSKSDDAKGFGALEHNTSTLVVLPESLSKQKLIKALTDIVSHEFFHIITPLRLHSEEIHYFDYNAPKMSEHLWLYEGVTEYFSVLFQITQGLISKEEFLARIKEKINTSKQYDDTMSFTTMSKNILSEPYISNYGNVYEKGALISMCIDLIIREQSEGREGILDLIKKLSNKFGADIPFKDKELIPTIKKLAYPEVTEFLKKHVVDNVPIDYEYYLAKVGIQYGVQNTPSSYFIFEQQPCVKGMENTQEIVFSSDVPLNSFLKKMGISNGDILLSINNKNYNIKNIYDLFGDSNKWQIGDPITFTIKRNNKIEILNSEVTEPFVETSILQQDPNAEESKQSLLEYWINE